MAELELQQAPVLGLVSDALAQYENDRLIVRKALEAFNSYSFAMRELVTARTTLAAVLEEVYVQDGSPFKKHATLFAQHLDPKKDAEYVDFVTKLKKATNVCRKHYDSRFAMLDKIVTFGKDFPGKSRRKEKVDEQISQELAGFHEQRLDGLDAVLVQAMDSEHRLGLDLQLPVDQMPLIAEAKNLNESRNENFSPKINMSLKHLLNNPNSVEYLKCFFRKRRMVEGLQFWLEVQKFKQLEDHLVVAGARFIYDLYVSENGSRQVNLASEDADPIHRTIQAPNRNIFDNAAKSIAALLEDNLGGFHTSVYHRQMISHFRPLRSFQEFVADVGGPPTSKVLANAKKGSFTSQPSTHSQTTEAESLISETLDAHRSITLPDITVTCMSPGPTDVLCGCIDGSIICLKYDKAATSIESSVVLPTGTIEGKVLNITRHSPTDLLVLTDRGAVKIIDLPKKKIATKLCKADPFATGVLRLDQNRIWISASKQVLDFVWNSKKKKFLLMNTKELSRVITTMVRIENTVWVGDELGGVTRLNMQTIHPVGERIRVATSPVHVIHRSDFSNRVKDLTSTTTRVWVSCRDSTLSVYGTDGNLVSKLDSTVHDLCVIGAANFDKHVVLASEDGSLSVWRPDSLQLEERLGKMHKDSINAVCCNTDQKLLYTAGLDRLIATWQAKPKNNTTASTLTTPTLPPIVTKRKSSRSARSKSMLESAPLHHHVGSLPSDEESSYAVGSPPTGSFTITVDSLLQLSRHPREAGSLTTHRGGLGSSSNTNTEDLDFDLARFSAHNSSDSVISSSYDTSPGQKLLQLSARSNDSAHSAHSEHSS